MCAKILCKGTERMTAAADAQRLAKELVMRESRGPGDMENAMRRLESKYGIPWRVFWSLRYRPPTDVMTGIYRRLLAAYLAECERQERLLRHEIEITKIKAGPDAPAVRAAAARGGEEIDD